MHTVSCPSVEFHTPTPYALGNNLPDELSAPGMAMSFSDADVNEVGELLDDQAISTADTLVRDELAEARAWLKTLTHDAVSVSRTVCDSDFSPRTRTGYMATVFGPTYLHGHGLTAMEAARDVARYLSVAAVA